MNKSMLKCRVKPVGVDSVDDLAMRLKSFDFCVVVDLDDESVYVITAVNGLKFLTICQASKILKLDGYTSVGDDYASEDLDFGNGNINGIKDFLEDTNNITINDINGSVINITAPYSVCIALKYSAKKIRKWDKR